MGAWGFGPYDNDTALDWLDGTGLQAAVAHHIEKALAKDDAYDEWRAATEVLISVGAGDQSVVLSMKAKDRLAEIRANEEYVNGWVDPTLFYDALDKQIESLDASLEALSPDVIEHAVAEVVTEDNPDPEDGKEVTTNLGQEEVIWVYDGQAERWRKK